jgi:hypothetical protein
MIRIMIRSRMVNLMGFTISQSFDEGKGEKTRAYR